MFMLCYNRFRLMPEYVDFLIAFGDRHYQEDFYSCGFPQRTHLADHASRDPNCNAASKQLQMCYSLKSAEPSNTDKWYIRQCAIHHTFELTQVQTTWTITKGDNLMKGEANPPLEEIHLMIHNDYVEPLPPSEDEGDDEGDESGEQRSTDTNNHSDDVNRDFSFGTRREVHAIATKASEAHKILVLSQLRNYYETITKRRSFPPEIAQNCRDSVDDFQLHVEGIEKDMQVQILRLEWLLSLINDRKNLVGPSTPKSIVLRHTIRVRVDSSQKTQYGWVNVADTNDAQLKSILDYQNTKANKSSTHSMVIMTEDMNDIARKTKIETVSMKVITLVTLFFLPGNFNSTLMSTDIFQQDYQGRP
ncbi:MAG: hypothetical protein LQ348_004241 [Seirophora lacunosa]|nr:MAG: hypothetical protein LQ348_004241 [Seirophora lacunosa]